MACIAIGTWVAYSGLHGLERFTPMRCNPLKYYGLTKACTVVQAVKINLGFFRHLHHKHSAWSHPPIENNSELDSYLPLPEIETGERT
jgi:hypothetical protein